MGKVLAVADWMPNVKNAKSEAVYAAFRQRVPKPVDDYVHLRMQLMVESLAQSIEKAGTTDSIAVSNQLESSSVTFGSQTGTMRASDHQFQQPLVVGLMDKLGAPGVKFDVEGSGYGFRIIKTLHATQAELPTTCTMQRPTL